MVRGGSPPHWANVTQHLMAAPLGVLYWHLHEDEGQLLFTMDSLAFRQRSDFFFVIIPLRKHKYGLFIDVFFFFLDSTLAVSHPSGHMMKV